MKKKWIVTLVLLLILATAVVAIVWYFGPGVHRVFRQAHFNFEDATCYVVNKEGNTVTGTTKLTMKGGCKLGGASGLDLCIDGYAEEGYEVTFRLESEGQLQGVFFKEDGTTVQELADMGQVWIVDGVPVFGFAGGEAVYIVAADSAEEALELVRSVKDN